MNEPDLGFAFALPRLLVGLAGKKVRAAEFSGAEAYGVGALVYLISCVVVARFLLPLVRPGMWRLLFLLALPPLVWIAWLLWYYFIALVIRPFRRAHLYSARTNTRFQHFVIMGLTTVLAWVLLYDQATLIRLLGAVWLALTGLNLLALAMLKLWR